MYIVKVYIFRAIRTNPTDRVNGDRKWLFFSTKDILPSNS